MAQKMSWSSKMEHTLYPGLGEEEEKQGKPDPSPSKKHAYAMSIPANFKLDIYAADSITTRGGTAEDVHAEADARLEELTGTGDLDVGKGMIMYGSERVELKDLVKNNFGVRKELDDLRAEFDDLMSRTKRHGMQARAIRRRHLRKFLLANPTAATRAGVTVPAPAAVAAEVDVGNVVAHEADSVGDREFFNEEEFAAVYGVTKKYISGLFKQKKHILIALVNLRSHHYGVLHNHEDFLKAWKKVEADPDAAIKDVKAIQGLYLGGKGIKEAFKDEADWVYTYDFAD